MTNPAARERGSQATVATVSEVCERHLAVLPDPRTVGTYRSRLRPMIVRYGGLPAPDALRKLDDIETELTDELGPAAAHKAVILLKAAARAAGFELLTLIAAAKLEHIAVSSLRALVDEERVRCCYRRTHGSGETLLFDRDQLGEDLRQLERCCEPGCDRPGTGPSGYCGEHFGQGGRRGAAEKEDRTLAARRDWWTVVEAARRAGVAHSTILNALSRGELASDLVGRHRRVPKQALDDWRRARRPPAPKLTSEQRAERRRELAELWEQGERRPGALADKLGVSKPTIYTDMEALGLERPGRGRQARTLPREAREARAAEVIDRYARGESYAQIEDSGLVSATEVGRILRGAGVVPRPQRRQSKYPAAAERKCEWCETAFTPPFPAVDVRGGKPKPQRFCTDQCAREWRKAQGPKALERRGLLGVRAAAQQSAAEERFISGLIGRDLLDTESVEFPGMIRPVHGIAPAELKGALRAWALGGDGRRKATLNPAYAIARAERSGRIDRMMAERGETREEALDIVRGRIERWRRELGRHAKGPRPKLGPSERDLRWLGEMIELRETRAYHQQRLELGLVDEQDGVSYDEALQGAARTECSLALEIAERDWRERPGENFPRDGYPPARENPAAMHPRVHRPAAKLVLRAVQRTEKALQSVGAEKTAG